MAWIRLPFRLAGFLMTLLTAAVLASFLRFVDLLPFVSMDRPGWSRRCFRLMCAALGWQVHIHGQPVTGASVLWVANHISWVDIPVLGSLVRTRFLSKSEVAHWPLIGWLARQGGTLFINRGSGRTGGIRRKIADHLGHNEPILVFPEGTTSHGLTVLPIHGRLLGAAGDADAMIQPVSLGYRRDDRPDHLAPFVGDDDFLPHLVRLLKQPPCRIEVIFHPPIAVATEPSAKALAARVHQTLTTGLARIHAGQLEPSYDDLKTVAGPGQPHPR